MNEHTCTGGVYSRPRWYKKLWREFRSSFWPTWQDKAFNIPRSYWERRRLRKKQAEEWSKFIFQSAKQYIAPIFKKEDCKPWAKIDMTDFPKWDPIDEYNKALKAKKKEDKE